MDSSYEPLPFCREALVLIDNLKGSHVVYQLLQCGFQVRVIDAALPPPILQRQEYEFIRGDLCDPVVCQRAVYDVTSIMHFAATMGGMGTIHEENDLIIYQENQKMTLNLLAACRDTEVKRFFYASSACVYPDVLQKDIQRDVSLREHDTWKNLSGPPMPQGLYGLEKLVTELILLQHPLKLDVRIARFHNVYGPGGAWNNGREKAPAALLRKACALQFIQSEPMTFEIWGDGHQRRSFLWVGDAVDAVLRLFTSKTVTGPVNIGSENAISIQELARQSLNVYVIDESHVTFKYLSNKPIGVASRNSDNTQVFSQLEWRPTTSIAKGMMQTGRWIEEEIRSTLSSSDQSNRRVLQDLQSSQLVRLDADRIVIATLLPITSRGSTNPDTCLENLARFASSFIRTTHGDTRTVGARLRTRIYLAIDRDDDYLRLSPDTSTNKAENLLRQKGISDVETILCDAPRGHICWIWSECARKAYDDGCDYFVLMGDDVILHDEGWIQAVHWEFQRIAESRHVPLGFGCVAFTDLSFPGMPTFPVLHRTHMDIFNKEVVPNTFINQDGDPFLFQLYRRWDCNTMLPCSLSNGVGGSEEARYTKQHATGWTFDILDEAVEKAERWLQQKHQDVQKMLTVDVVVPCYRVDIPLLDGILSLKPSDTCSVMFIIIIDNPTSPHAYELESKYGRRPDIRIRRNAYNIGASGSRNRGIDESAADWIIFLDDDIAPRSDLFIEAEKAIRENPTAAGFVGNSLFPKSGTIFTAAIRIAGVAFFWDIATKIHDDVPWGVTANLIARRNVRDGVRYDLSYPKTGGGEDIEFCRHKRKYFLSKGGKGFIGAPNVVVTHPWWNKGARSYKRFYMWSYGDGALVKRFPEISYRDYCLNSAELLLLSGLTSIISPFFLSPRTSFLLSVKLIVSVIAANTVHDCYRHLWRDANRHENMDTTLRGVKWGIAVIESTVIRIASEMGRLHGMLVRHEFSMIGKRFDWFAGRWGEGPRNEERMNNLQRTALVLGIFCWFIA
ncbi:hypothetical protein AX15_007312 [Amanita polypyramis BW_CC]|nr:hypothetical protein AX15_007312 [Amanita polypyramis BW_CC]